MTNPKERPILFSGEMVRAILSGKKTQTRRVIKRVGGVTEFLTIEEDIVSTQEMLNRRPANAAFLLNHSPYGRSGDLLYVREAWSAYEVRGNAGGNEYKEYPNIIYRADNTSRLIIRDDVWKYVTDELKWRPSIHMPKWASRLWLRVKEVRVERVQDISEEDAIAESVRKEYGLWRCYDNCPEHETGHCYRTSATASFMSLWNAINGKRDGCSWDNNPWCWCISFEVQHAK